ncbi:MAG: hypothetical protein NTZ26_12610 [Candidatus Aminicenantes bacterium]|nr:hypothetical protein [Candidatus Aminicenantes bacterium]
MPMKKSGILGLGILLAVIGLAAFSQAASGYDKRFEIAKARNEGWYTSLSIRPQFVQGDFRSRLVLWHFEKAFFIPRLTKGSDLDVGLAIGRKSAYGSWEVRYSLALPQAVVADRTQGIQIHNLEISGRSYFWPGEILQPYGQIGINVPLIVVPDGAAFQGANLNAMYVGVGLNAGAGLTWDFAPDTFLDIGLVYRFLAFFYAYGEGKGRDINHLRTVQDGDQFGRLLRSSSLALTASLNFMF